jgi:hypothetical protein
MSPEQSMWERVDLPVLRLVAGCDYAAGWRFDRQEPTEEIPVLTGTELDSALRRLEGYDLIQGRRREASGYFMWWRLRPTPDGWRVLGEWPPASEADMGAALVEILRALADDANEEEAKPLRRAAGSFGRLAGRVVFDVAKSEIRRAGGDLAS